MTDHEFLPTRQTLLSRLKKWDDTESWRAGLPADWHLWMRMGRCGVRTGALNQIVTLMPLRPGETAITELQFKD